MLLQKLRVLVLVAVAFGSKSDKKCSVNGKSGLCVNIRDCEPIFTKYISKVNIKQLLCGYEGLYPKVCCIESGSKVYSLPTDCGINNKSIMKRILNGEPASLGEFPWLAVLGYHSTKISGSTSWRCVGSLITGGHVLTSAHCIHGNENVLYVVRLGEVDFATENDGAEPLDFSIEKLIKHEEYDPSKRANDIAIIKLTSDVTFTKLISPICLPVRPELRSKNFEGTMPFIAGWGETSYMGKLSTKLLMAQVPVVTNSQCYKTYKRFKNQTIDQRVLCAGYSQGLKDACRGDSGGPLMWPSSSIGSDKIYYYQIGIVSYGFKCGEPGYPGVYTRITEFLPWIESNLNK